MKRVIVLCATGGQLVFQGFEADETCAWELCVFTQTSYPAAVHRPRAHSFWR